MEWFQNSSLLSKPQITSLLTFFFHGWCLQIDLLIQIEAIYYIAASAQIITVVNSHLSQRAADELQSSERHLLAYKLCGWKKPFKDILRYVFWLASANFQARLDWHIIVRIAKDVWSESRHIYRGGRPAVAVLIRKRWGLRLMSCTVGRVKREWGAGKYLISIFNQTAGKDDVA